MATNYKLKTILLSFLVSSASLFSQNWQVQNSGTTVALRHVHFVNANTGYIVGHSGTILKTTNGGQNWVKLNFSQQFATVIGCYFINENTGWIGGDMGVMKTTDGGANWSFQTGPEGITKLYFVDANTGWAVGGGDGVTPTYGDIYKTTNGGAQWTKTSKTTEWARFYGVQFVDANYGWAYAEVNGLLVGTTDGGATWNTLINNSTNLIRGLYFKDRNTGWFCGRSSTSGLSYKSTNAGVNWTNIAGQLNFSLNSVRFVSDLVGYATSGPAIMKTTDGGVTWAADYTGTVGFGSSSTCFVDANHGWAVGEGGIILRYLNSSSATEQLQQTENLFIAKQNDNGNIKFIYNVKNTCNVTLKIYDMDGKCVLNVINEIKPTGKQETDFINIPHKGVYLAKLVSGNETKVLKVIFR
jgi:photosystem II stability/assembly factor-like uncharacterized protein